jgi:type VI secretion system protein ImpH
MATADRRIATLVKSRPVVVESDAPPGDRYPPGSVAACLYREPFAFAFFQAVRLLEKIYPQRRPVGRPGNPAEEVVRLRAHAALWFPPSAIFDLKVEPGRPTVLTTPVLGLFGPSGVLPRHYTEMILRLQREAKGPERYALRDWLDLFNHRFLSLFYRAWEKYRFYIPYERGEYALDEPDTFTRCLFSLIGMGLPGLRRRLHVSRRDPWDGQQRRLAAVQDLVLLYYGGLLAHRPRNACSLAGFLRDYFQIPVQVREFQGQWLPLTEDNRSRLGGAPDANNQLGVNMVVGERVWEVQGKFRVRVGPLHEGQFLEFLPDRTPTTRRKSLFVLVHLARLYAGPDYSFDVQLVLAAEEVRPCALDGEGGLGARLGWNTWLVSQEKLEDADDAVFEGEEVYIVNE